MGESGAGRFAGVRIEGQDFALRAWRADDLASLVRHANDAAVAERLSDRFPHPYTRDDGLQFLSGAVVSLQDPVFAIVIEGQACGGIGARLGQGERAHVAELGYWLGRQYWGRGVMTAVVGAYLEWLLPACHVRRVQAFTLGGNLASARVLLKNGFEEEGWQRGVIQRGEVVHDLRLFGRLAASPA